MKRAAMIVEFFLCSVDGGRFSQLKVVSLELIHMYSVIGVYRRLRVRQGVWEIVQSRCGCFHYGSIRGTIVFYFILFFFTILLIKFLSFRFCTEHMLPQI